MKTFKSFAAVALLAIGSAVSGAASAAVTGLDFSTGTNLGAHNPTIGESSSFTHNNMAVGSFSETWYFSINPAGDASLNAIFIPSTAISGFDVKLFNAAGTSVGSLIAPATPVGAFAADLAFTSLAAGDYAFIISGTVLSAGIAQRVYSGNLTTQPGVVPVPATLALIALGLMGSAVSLRKRKTA